MVLLRLKIVLYEMAAGLAGSPFCKTHSARTRTKRAKKFFCSYDSVFERIFSPIEIRMLLVKFFMSKCERSERIKKKIFLFRFQITERKKMRDGLFVKCSPKSRSALLSLLVCYVRFLTPVPMSLFKLRSRGRGAILRHNFIWRVSASSSSIIVSNSKCCLGR